MSVNEHIPERWGRTSSYLIAALSVFCIAATSAQAVDLEDFYLRHDFSSGARETFYGASSTLSKDPISLATATAVYGQDGAGTAVYPGSAWGEAFGSNGTSSLLNSDWSVAASVRAAPVEGGVIFSLGRLNSVVGGVKAVALCSSSTNGKLNLRVLSRNGDTRSVENSDEATVADTQNGYHAVVLVYKATATGQGTFTLYFDGAQAATVDATSSMPFGNSFQYASLLSTGASDAANLGCVSVAGGNTELAFQDMRVFTSALAAEDAAAYAALYPATLPAFTENLDQYAYVQSYGENAVNPGYLVKKDTTFAVDFEYTEISKQARIFGCYSSYTSNISNDGLSSGLYINGSLQFAFAKFSTFVSGGTWMTFAGQVAGDTERRIFSTEDKSTDKTIGTLSLNDRSGAKDGTTTANHGTDATKPIYLFANNKNGDANYNSKARIYSFGASEGTTKDPAIFLAPAEENGAAGFRDIVSGAFHGDIVQSPSQALTYQPGIGQASDYRYRSGKFYARIYAVSAGASTGLVKFEGGEAARTSAQFTARGRTAKISAVLPSGRTPTVEWSGDTWAIVEGGTVNDATITVKSDTAIRLVATFSEEGPVWTDNDGTGSLDNEENWTRMPQSGEDVVLDLLGDTAIVSGEVKTFGKMTIAGAYSVDFSGADVVSCSSVGLSGVTNLVAGGKLQFQAIDIPSGCTATITGAEGLADGGLTGAGTLVVDPGAGNTFTMSKENNSFTGEAVVKSGVVRLGNATSFGPLARGSFIRVKGGATLDEGDAASQAYDKEKNKVILEEGASFVYSGTNTDPKTHAITTLTLEGNATVDTSIKDVAIGRHFNWDYSHINLGANTLTVTGGKTFYISICQVSGTGTIDIQEDTIVDSTCTYDGYYTTTTCANGSIRIRHGGKWRLAGYNGHASHLSVKNLILDGQIVRDANTYNLTVIGQITGNGTTPMLKMGAGAVFKPTGKGYLTIAESLSGTMTIDLSGFDLTNAKTRRIPLFKTGTAAILPAEDAIVLTGGANMRAWKLRKTDDGLGYDFVRKGFYMTIR